MDWYCVYTKPKRELQAIEHIETRLGFEVFFPRITRTKVIRRVRHQVTEPLFPRYFFCRFEMGLSYRSVRYAHNVLDLVSFGSEPSVVSDEMLEQMKRWACTASNTIEARSRFVSGDRVQITDGPMKGLEAVILEDKSEAERVAILLWILGCGARLSIDREALDKIA